MSGARGLLINITGGEDMTLFEVDQAANRIREEVDEDANIIFGAATDDTLEGRIRVSVVATGIETAASKSEERPRLVAVGGMQNVRAAGGQPPAATSPNGPAQDGTNAGGTNAGGASAEAGSGQPLSMVGNAVNVARAPGQAPRMQPPMSVRAIPTFTAQGGQGPAATASHAFQPSARDHDAAGVQAGSYAPALDETPAGPRMIPAHLQQPLKPQSARPVRPSARPPAGMFNDPGRTGTEPAAAPPRKTLFGIVTGVFRVSAAPQLPAEAPRAPSRPEPAAQDHGAGPAAAETHPDHGGQQIGQDERDLDIPTFLRRQTSGQSGT